MKVLIENKFESNQKYLNLRYSDCILNFGQFFEARIYHKIRLQQNEFVFLIFQTYKKFIIGGFIIKLYQEKNQILFINQKVQSNILNIKPYRLTKTAQQKIMKPEPSQDIPNSNTSVSIISNSQSIKLINSQISLSTQTKPRNTQVNGAVESSNENRQQSSLGVAQNQMKKQEQNVLRDSLIAQVNSTVNVSQQHQQGQKQKNFCNLGQVKEISNKQILNSLSFHDSKQQNDSQILKTSQEKLKLQSNIQIESEKQQKYFSILSSMTSSLQQNSRRKIQQNSQRNQQSTESKEKQKLNHSSEYQFQNVSNITKIEIVSIQNSYSEEDMSHMAIKQNSNTTIEKILLEIQEEEIESLLININDNDNEKNLERTQVTKNTTNSLLESTFDFKNDSGFEFEFGNTDKNQGEYLKAIEHFEAAIKLHKQKPTNIQTYALLLLNTAETYFQASNYTKAVEKCQLILNLQIQKNSKWDLIVNCYHIYAQSCCYLKRQQEALKSGKLALQILNTNFQTKSIRTQKTYRIMGAAYACQQKFTQAIEYYRKSFQLAKELNNNSEVSQPCLKALSGLGFCYNYMGQHEKDLKNNFKILQISEQLLHTNNKTFVSIYSDIGLSYIHLNKHHDAEIYLRKAQSKLKELNSYYLIENGFLIFNFCLLQKSKRNYTKALAYLYQSEKILKQKLPVGHFYVNQAQKQLKTILELMKENPQLALTENQQKK